MQATDPVLRVLILDDDEIDRRAARRALGAGFEVEEAATEAEAMALLQSHQPDCILLDYLIPGANTLHLVAELARRGLAAVMLTGQGNETVAVAAMKNGAQDYLIKEDYTAEELRAGVRNAVAKNQRARRRAESRKKLHALYHAEKGRRHELEYEIALAHDIQQNLIPAAPPNVAGLDIAAAFVPAAATSGDFFDYLTPGGNALGIVVGDVAGHGLGPALLAAETRAYVRALSLTETKLAAILSRAHHLLVEDCKADIFVTILLARIKVDTRVVSYAGAGQRAFLLRAAGERLILPGAAPPLGVSPIGDNAAERTVSLSSGDLLLLMTDGVFETRNAGGEHFGVTRCFDAAFRERSKPAEKIADALYAAARAFAGAEPQHDDITIVVIKAV